MPFKLFPQQRLMLQEHTGRDVTVKGRQTRASSLILARNLRRMTTGFGLRCLVITQSDQVTDLFRARIEHHLKDLAAYGLDYPVRSNKEELVIGKDMGNRYIFGSGEDRVSGRAYAANMAHLSEVAWWKPENTSRLLGGITPAVPGPPDGWFDIESTPNGAEGDFYNYVKDAQDAGDPLNRWTLHFYPWFLEPRYRAGVVGADQCDFQLPADELERLIDTFEPTAHEARLLEVFGLDVLQILWRRSTERELMKTGTPFLQEYVEEVDSCQPPEETVLCGGSPRRIGDLCVGDSVLGMDGKDHTVTALNRRDYRGELVRLTPTYLPSSRFTGDHPIYARRNLMTEPLWVAARNLKAGWYVHSPTPQSEGDTTILWPYDPYLLGLWLAEGCVYPSRDMVIFTFGAHEQDLVDLVHGVWGGSIAQMPRNAVQVRITNRGLCGLLQQFVDPWEKTAGRKGASRTKHLPEAYLRQRPSYGVDLLRGWLRGDGHLSEVKLAKGKTKTTYTGTTVSERLAWQMWSLARRAGLQVSLHKYRMESDAWRWNLGFYGASADVVAGNQRWSVHSPGRKEGNWCRLRRVQREQYDGPVCNLKAEGSYVSAGIVSSNCFITGSENFFTAPDGVDHLGYYKTLAVEPAEKIDGLSWNGAHITFYGPNLRVWERPDPRQRYVGYLDTAEGGHSNESDFSALAVVNIFTKHHAATLRLKAAPSEVGAMACAVMGYYNTGMLGGERGPYGSSALDRIRELHYPNVYYHVDYNSPRKEPEAWIFPTQKNRDELLRTFRETIFERSFLTRDKILGEEMGTFSWEKTRFGQLKAQAKRRKHDDLVIAAAGANFIAQRQRRYQLSPEERSPETIVVKDGVVVGREPAGTMERKGWLR